MGVRNTLHQGDKVKVERINNIVLVVSKDFFNQTGEIIACPIFSKGVEGPLHIKVKTDKTEGYVQCEKLALLDMNVRGFSKVDRIAMSDIINITDAVQSIFDYV